MKEETIDYIKIHDIDLASVLYCLGFTIDGLYESGVGDRMDFYFRSEDRLVEAMNDYIRRKLRMEPSELFNARKILIIKLKDETSTRKFKKGNG